MKIFDVTVTFSIEAETGKKAADLFVEKLLAKREVQATVRECVTPTRSGPLERHIILSERKASGRD